MLARNFAVMTGVNAGLQCAIKKARGGVEDVQGRCGGYRLVVLLLSSPAHSQHGRFLRRGRSLLARKRHWGTGAPPTSERETRLRLTSRSHRPLRALRWRLQAS